MDFKDQIKQISERVEKIKDNLQTEEATKNALIMPFLQAMGYDVFNPIEVLPEFVCDIGTKKGEKIDYAIFMNGEPAILIECKHWAQDLTLHDNQLLRYFHVSKAKFAILTNGIQYKFYTDIETPNKMDEKPFLDINIMDLKSAQIEELKKFHKSYFDVDSILNSASELKYTNELKSIINEEFQHPSPDFVRLYTKQVYSSVVTAKVLEQFTGLVKKSVQQIISDLISERLKSALKSEQQESQAEKQQEPIITTESDGIVTTEEELEGYMIVKAILHKDIDISRVVYRDALSYFAILFDDNNRKPICRLYFNGVKKYIATFDTNKKEAKKEIFGLNDIYKYSGELSTIVNFYLSNISKGQNEDNIQ